VSLVDKLRLLEAVVRTPRYFLAGYTGGKLIYLSTVEGATDIWALDLSTKHRRRLTEGGIAAIAKPSEKTPLVVYTRDVTKGEEQHQVFVVHVDKEEKKLLFDAPPMRIFGIAFDGERVAFTGATRAEMGLYLGDISGSYEKLVKLESLAIVTDVNEEYIVGYGTFAKNPKSMELFIYSLEENRLKVYTPKEGSINKSPRLNKSKILFETNAFGGNKLAVYDIESGELTRPEFTYSDYAEYFPTENSVFDWTKDGKIWVIGDKNGRTRVFIDGKKVPLPEGTTTNIAIVGDKVYASHSSLTRPYQIYEVDLKTNEVKVLIETDLPPEVEEKLGEVLFIKYKSFDGLEIPAYVVKSNAAPEPGPTIIYVHGGPWSQVADLWNTMIASLVVCGYHVVAPNFRGSTGYGEDFRILDIGDPGGGDLQDVIYARKWALENKLASKVAIMGYSYGGYMTFLATAKHPELWTCGVAGAGITDWEELYELSDALFKQFVNILFAGRRDLWKDRSPATYVDQAKTPICIIHPQNDTRTPLRPVLKYVQRLLENKVTFEVHVVPDIGHAINKLEDMLKILLPAILFLEKYLKKE